MDYPWAAFNVLLHHKFIETSIQRCKRVYKDVTVLKWEVVKAKVPQLIINLSVFAVSTHTHTHLSFICGHSPPPVCVAV